MVVACSLTVICYVIISQGLPTSAGLELVAPKFISAFSYDVAVHARNATMGDVVELFANNQSEAVTAQIITKSSESSTLIFNCGYFFQTGTYFFKIRSAGGEVLASSQRVTALDRPKVSIEWEKRHEALTTDVKVSLRLRGKICKSDIARQNKLFVTLSRFGNYTGPKTSIPKTDKQLVETFPVVISSETFIPSYVVLPCEKFNTAGLYQTDLMMTSPGGDDITVSTSAVMDVDWSKDYDLKLLKHSFPCTGAGVTVSLSFPPCASAEDSVRLLSMSNGTRKVIASQTRGSEDHVTFPCSAFYNMNQTVEGFCFQYVTTGNYVARTVCEAVSRDSAFQMSGAWSPWMEWSICERPCQRSIKRRKRLCDNPTPAGGGDLCRDMEGKESVEELAVKDSNMPWGSCDDASMTSLKSEQCECGCSIEVEDRGALVSSLTNDCEGSKTVIWTVSVPASHVILFKLDDYQLASDEVLTIRDGRTSWPMTSKFPSVMSRSNIVIVQWVKSKAKNNLNSCGFILSFEAVVKPTSDTELTTLSRRMNSTLGSGIGGWIEDTVTNNPVLLAGIGACVLIIAVVVTVVVVHCRRKRKTKAKIPPGLRTPMNTRLAMPPDGRSCSNADDTESEPMVRPRPIGNAGNCEVINDTCIPMQPSVGSGTAYYLAQRQLELMKRLGKEEHSQTYATGFLSDEALRQQEDLLFGDRRSLHKNEELRVT